MGQLGSVYKQPETGEDGPDTAGGCQVSTRGLNGGARGLAEGGKQGECAVYICECVVCVTE